MSLEVAAEAIRTRTELLGRGLNLFLDGVEIYHRPAHPQQRNDVRNLPVNRWLFVL